MSTHLSLVDAGRPSGHAACLLNGASRLLCLFAKKKGICLWGTRLVCVGVVLCTLSQMPSSWGFALLCGVYGLLIGLMRHNWGVGILMTPLYGLGTALVLRLIQTLTSLIDSVFSTSLFLSIIWFITISMGVRGPQQAPRP